MNPSPNPNQKHSRRGTWAILVAVAALAIVWPSSSARRMGLRTIRLRMSEAEKRTHLE